MIVGTPHKLDCIANRSVESERNISEDALSGCNNDGMRSASTVATLSRSRLVGCAGRREVPLIGQAFWDYSLNQIFEEIKEVLLTLNAVIVSLVPLCISRAVDRRFVVRRGGVLDLFLRFFGPRRVLGLAFAVHIITTILWLR